VLVAQRAQALDESLAAFANAALALDRLDQDAGSVRADQRLGRFQIVEIDIVEAGQQGRKPLCIFSWSDALIVPIVRPWKALRR
jgi:hypothetical protein